MAKYDNWYKQVRVFGFLLKEVAVWEFKISHIKTIRKGVEEGSVQYNLDNLSFCPYL